MRLPRLLLASPLLRAVAAAWALPGAAAAAGTPQGVLSVSLAAVLLRGGCVRCSSDSSSGGSSAPPGDSGEQDDGQQHVKPIDLQTLLQRRPRAATAAATAAGGASASAQQAQQQASSSAWTEQQLALLFDAELQQRLESAAAARRSAGSSSDPPACAPPDGNASGWGAEQQQEPAPATQLLPPFPAHSAWSPLVSSDPWAPLPSPALARQRLPEQVLHLLQQAGVPHDVAAAALAHNGRAAAGAEAAALQQQQAKLAPQHSSGAAVLNRLQAKQLKALLEEAQAPTFGSKKLLVQRVLLLLQEQHMLQQGLPAPAPTTPSDAAWSGEQADQAEDAEDAEAYTEQAGAAAPAPQQPVHPESSGTRASSSGAARALAEAHAAAAAAANGGAGPALAAARQRLLRRVLDVRQIGEWLMAARAQDVAVVDLRGRRAALQTHLVVATGLNQRHAHACAEAVAWQLREAAKAVLGLGQQQQQQQQQQSLEQPADSIDSRDARLPPLPVLGDAGSDWCVLDAGRVVVHVLTARARRFYDLEALGERVSWLQPPHEAGGGRVETLATIGRPTAAAR